MEKACSCHVDPDGSSSMRRSLVALAEACMKTDSSALNNVDLELEPLKIKCGSQVVEKQSLPDVSSMSALEMLDYFHKLQTDRVTEYKVFHRDFASLLSSGDVVMYQQACSLVTKKFSFLSSRVNSIVDALQNFPVNEAVCGVAAKDRTVQKIAACIVRIQQHEKQKLSLTAKAQILQHALAANHVEEEEGLPALSELRSMLHEEMSCINDILDEVMCFRYTLNNM